MTALISIGPTLPSEQMNIFKAAKNKLKKLNLCGISVRNKMEHSTVSGQCALRWVSRVAFDASVSSVVWMCWLWEAHVIIQGHSICTMACERAWNDPKVNWMPTYFHPYSGSVFASITSRQYTVLDYMFLWNDLISKRKYVNKKRTQREREAPFREMFFSCSSVLISEWQQYPGLL